MLYCDQCRSLWWERRLFSSNRRNQICPHIITTQSYAQPWQQHHHHSNLEESQGHECCWRMSMRRTFTNIFFSLFIVTVFHKGKEKKATIIHMSFNFLSRKSFEIRNWSYLYKTSTNQEQWLIMKVVFIFIFIIWDYFCKERMIWICLCTTPPWPQWSCTGPWSPVLHSWTSAGQWSWHWSALETLRMMVRVMRDRWRLSCWLVSRLTSSLETRDTRWVESVVSSWDLASASGSLTSMMTISQVTSVWSWVGVSCAQHWSWWCWPVFSLHQGSFYRTQH